MKKLMFLLPLLLVGCSFGTSQQGTMGVRVVTGQWGIEVFHETPDTDEAHATIDVAEWVKKPLISWFIDTENQQSVEAPIEE